MVVFQAHLFSRSSSLWVVLDWLAARLQQQWGPPPWLSEDVLPSESGSGSDWARLLSLLPQVVLQLVHLHLDGVELAVLLPDLAHDLPRLLLLPGDLPDQLQHRHVPGVQKSLNYLA